MAAVIRDARIEPERRVLAIVAGSAPARPSPAAPPPPAAVPPANAAPAWMDELPAADADGLQLEVDREAEAAAFRERLETERGEILARAEAEGYAAGLRRGEEQFAAQIDALGAVIASAHTALESGIAGTEDVMVEIAFEAVCKIMGEAMMQSPGVVAIVREVLRGMRERERLVVRVAPADHALLEQHRAQLLQGDDGRTLDLVADERVVLGGCLVETSGGTLDGRLETQLQRLAETLVSARRMAGEGMP